MTDKAGLRRASDAMQRIYERPTTVPATRPRGGWTVTTMSELDESRTTPSDVSISAYRATGRPEFSAVEVS